MTAPIPTQHPGGMEPAPEGRPVAVDVRSLSLRYGTRTVLDDVTLTVPGGGLFALLGPNGSGKSTLLRILATLLRPAAGSAAVAGLDIQAAPAAVRHRLGVVFQAPGLDGKLSVLENLRFQGNLYGLRGRALRERATHLLERFALLERAGDRVETLSGGLKRRAELAKALLHRPSVLLLDEPSTGLDLGARNAFWDTLADLRNGEELTVIVATHLMDEAERCARVALLDAGRLVALDTPANLKQRVGATVMTLEAPDAAALAPAVEARFGLQGVVENGALRLADHADAALAPRLLEAFPDEMTALRVGRPTLGDVFLALTGRSIGGGQPPEEGA